MKESKTILPARTNEKETERRTGCTIYQNHKCSSCVFFEWIIEFLDWRKPDLTRFLAKNDLIRKSVHFNCKKVFKKQIPKNHKRNTNAIQKKLILF